MYFALFYDYVPDVLERRNLRATIVGATSGDTGAAAIEAFRGLERVDVFILYPKGRVSDVQRRQMTTVANDNIHVIALEGSFDDAQNILKRLFRNAPFRESVGLAGVNSINWARIVAQTVYYFTSAVYVRKIQPFPLISPQPPVSREISTTSFNFSVPTTGLLVPGAERMLSDDIATRT